MNNIPHIVDTGASVEPMTLREIAESEGISHQAVAEILARALRKMAKALEDKKIKIEDLL